jgi:hypothetical protein
MFQRYHNGEVSSLFADLCAWTSSEVCGAKRTGFMCSVRGVWGVEVQFQLFETSALEWSASCPGRFSNVL